MTPTQRHRLLQAAPLQAYTPQTLTALADVTANFGGAPLAFAFIIPLILWDRRTIGHLHWATKAAIAALAFGSFARYIVWGLGIWPSIVALLPY